jgi:uncharacterized protein
MGAILLLFRAYFSPTHRFRWRSGLICIIAATLTATLTSCAWIDHKQRELIYRPAKDYPASFKGLRAGDEVLEILIPNANAANSPASTSATHSLKMWWLPHQEVSTAPTLLYLHGTFRNLYHNLRKIEALRAAGFSVLAVEYRGWGDSSPITPSESSIYMDADAAWAELVKRQPDARKRVIFGHSMGTGVATQLASSKQVGADYGGLILESSFTRLPDVAKAAGVLGTMMSWLATQEFNSLIKINQVNAPILMMHGTADNTVPYALGRKLFAAAPPGARWVSFEGGSHSGLDLEAPERYKQAIQDLIRRLPQSLGQ